ncbi:MAG TPA: transposase [Gammaproteobacteria bacterium]|nr:transposase [Gammaproteobacteria bacterium]
MVNYRRVRLLGGTYFFTVTLTDRRSDLLLRHVDALRLAFGAVRRASPFRIDALVVLPDHLHAVWTLPTNDADYSRRWHDIKSSFTRMLRRHIYVPPPDRKGQYQIWQARFWEHLITDDEDYAQHVDYVHFNPVKHGFVRRPDDWQWSSIHRYTRAHSCSS